MNITKENTVAEVVSKKLGSDHIFSKYKIDFCCGGGMTLEAACIENGIEFAVLKNEIDAINTKIVGESIEVEEDLEALITIIKKEYHQYIDENLPVVLQFSEKVAGVHGAHNPEVVEIFTLLKGVEVVLTETMENSLMKLYPAVVEIQNSVSISSEKVEGIKSLIQNNEAAQQLIGDTFKEISKLSSHYLAPDDACNSYRFLYEKLHELDHQLQKYMHFYKHTLVPKIVELMSK